MQFRSTLAVFIILLLLGFPALTIAQDKTPPPLDSVIQLKIAGYQLEPSVFPNFTPATGTMLDLDRTAEGIDPYSAMAFQSGRDGNWNIYLANGGAANLIRLTDSSRPDLRPQVRRGADMVLFVRAMNDTNFEIFRINADGSGETRLTEWEGVDHYPIWSSDGNTILFASDRTGNFELFRMDLQGGSLEQITNNPASDRSPTISPDGTRMAWVRVVSQSAGQLMVANSDGSGEYPATAPITFLQNPVWSPDGSKIAFDGDLNGDYWNDVATLTVANGAVQLWLAGGYLVDLWAGAWHSMDSAIHYYSRVQYRIAGNSLAVDALDIRQSNSGEIVISSGAYDYQPSVASTDNTLPITSLEPITSFSPMDGIHLQWSGTDAGPAPIAHYELQTRELPAQSEWVDAGSLPASQESLRYRGGSPNSVMEFRLRGVDAAGNIGAWSAAVNTRLYTRYVDVRVFDGRGYPLREATVSLAPGAAGAMSLGPGASRQFQTALDAGSVTVTVPGMGSVPSSRRSARFNTYYDVFITDSDNLIQNGGFENLLTHWQTEGVPAVTNPLHSSHSGAGVAVLGGGCGRCWSAPLVLDDTATSGYDYSSSSAVLSANGTLHMVYRDRSDGRIYYRFRPRAGTWSAGQYLDTGDYFTHSGNIPPVALTMTADGTLHLSYPKAENIVYSSRSLQGTWSAPLNVFPRYVMIGATNRLISDRRGNVYLMSVVSQEGTASLQIRQRTSNGVWQAPFEVVRGSYGGNDAQIAILPDGTIHVLYRSYSRHELLHRIRDAQGNWGEARVVFPERYALNQNQYALQLFVDDVGVLHALASQDMWLPNRDLLYSVYHPTEQRWAVPDVIAPPPVTQYPDMRAIRLFEGPNNEILLYIASSSVDTPDWVVRRNADGRWDEPYPEPLDNTQIHSLEGYYDPAFGWSTVTDSHNTQVGTRVMYREWLRAEESAEITLSQSITIPLTMPMPTLSWMVDVPRALPNGQSAFEVRVQDVLTTTIIHHETGMKPGWRLEWADLSPWQGESITVTFALIQAEEEPWLLPRIDDIAIAGYRSPIITTLTPSSIENGWEGEVITITGANFTTPVTVTVNGKVATANRLNDNTMEVTLPAGLRPGVVELIIRNGYGRTQYDHTLRLGISQFLPLLQNR
jgi:hypothetical protein